MWSESRSGSFYVNPRKNRKRFRARARVTFMRSCMMAVSVKDLRSDRMDEDEFTCAGVLRGALLALQPTVQQVFGVILTMADEHTISQDGQMWIRLCGDDKDVKAAKLFVKGVVNQETQQELQFPEALHCVFCGAKGLFMDCLIKNTSAHLMLGSQNCLLISGLAEPVVKAYSFITDLIEKYKSSQSRRYDPAGDSFDSRQNFMTLVESHEDRHALDLLVLPVIVKEVLLELVKQSGLSGNRTHVTPVNPRSPQSSFAHHGANGTDDSASERTIDAGGAFVPISIHRTHLEERASPQEDESETSQHEPVQPSSGNREKFQHLLEFFSAMGFTDEVVQRVLARTGPKEPSQLLDLIQQEQDKSVQNKDDVSTETKETLITSGNKDEDFVLGVMKAAAATCGYTEERVEQVYGNLTDLKPHQLLLELQRQHNKETDGTPGDDTEADRRIETKSTMKLQKSLTTSSNHDSLQSVRGPPQMTYLERSHLETLNTRDRQPFNSHPQQNSPKEPKIFQRRDMRSKPRASAGATAVITGPQRFIESLKMPFKLQLSDDPGDVMLRQIIIDGSNVAMSHGLKVFFSCRGIALAVQHFWGRGHRKITVFVPQWRQKKDPKIKEQHYLNDLQDLGLLSFTPSREIEGRRINSYDDRFMLQLAQKTNGVIVTNDNMRDLVDESPAWRDIIKRSILQYVFSGDLFMLPDDPMGLGGPHLSDFLHAQNSLPVAGFHSFAGVSSNPPPTPAVRAHTQVLQYRDRTPGGQGSDRGQGWGHDEEVRTTEETLMLRQDLMQIFPDQESVIIMMLQRHPSIRDIFQLTDFILEQQD